MAKKDKNAQSQEKESVTSGISKKFKQSPILYIGSVFILVLVIVTFIGGDLLSGGTGGRGGDLTFGYYDRAPISWVPGNMFSDYYERLFRFYQSQGVSVDNFQVAAQIWRQAYDAAVVHTAVQQIMKRSNYTVPERTVNRRVAQLPMFQDNGRFSPALYNQMSDTRRMSIWRQTQEDLTISMYYGDLFGMQVPVAEADFIANMASPMRSFDMVSFRVDDFPASEYLVFARENAELFFSAHLSKVTVSSEREATRILQTINNGTTSFEEVARSQSLDVYSDRGGDMGIRYFHELDWEIPALSDRQMVFTLGRGQLSNVVNTSDGWAIFRMEEELTHANFEDAAVMDRVRSYVRSFERGRMEDWAIAQAYVFISEVQTSGLDNVIRRRNMEKQSFGPLPLNFGNIEMFTSLDSFNIQGLSSQDLTDVARNESFWRIAFSTVLNAPSEPFVHGNNVFVLVPTEQISADIATIEEITSMYSFWLNGFQNDHDRSITGQSLQVYFLKHAKMEDNFWDVYFRVFMP